MLGVAQWARQFIYHSNLWMRLGAISLVGLKEVYKYNMMRRVEKIYANCVISAKTRSLSALTALNFTDTD